jgi:hypothetical protein
MSDYLHTIDDSLIQSERLVLRSGASNTFLSRLRGLRSRYLLRCVLGLSPCDDSVTIHTRIVTRSRALMVGKVQLSKFTAVQSFLMPS